MLILRMLRILLIGAMGLFLMDAALAATIRVSEAKIFLEIPPGGIQSGEVEVENPTPDEAQVRIYAEDWSYLPSGTGEKEFFAAGTLPRSASEWIAFNPVEMTLAPFAKKILNYTVTAPPEGVEGTYHTVLFFETLLGEVKDQEGASVQVAARLGSLFFVDIKGKGTLLGTVDTIEIIPPRGNRATEFGITFTNRGNRDITLEGHVMILDSRGLVKGRGELKSIYTEGGMTVASNSTWVGKLDPGTYDLIFTFDLGGGKSLVEERSMSVE